MVRFSSNLKRPKVVVKQNVPLMSKEAPSNFTFAQSKFSQFTINHGHTRSTPTSPNVSSILVQEIGLSTGQAVKKLIKEIDRILKLYPIKRPSNSFTAKLSFLLRYASLLTLTILSQCANFSSQMGLFSGFILISEYIFIELMEKKRMNSSVPNSMKAIRNKLRTIDKSLLVDSLDLDSLYTTVALTIILLQ